MSILNILVGSGFIALVATALFDIFKSDSEQNDESGHDLFSEW